LQSFKRDLLTERNIKINCSVCHFESELQTQLNVKREYEHGVLCRTNCESYSPERFNFV